MCLSAADAVVADGDGGKRLVYSAANSGAGRRQYGVFSPSHPQAVNQYVRSYNHGTKKDEKPRNGDAAARELAACTYAAQRTYAG